MKLARRMPPWMWLTLVILYFLVPTDVLPDFLGLPGRVDDLLVALIGMFFMHTNAEKKTGHSQTREKGKSGGDHERGEREAGSAAEGRRPDPRDPYEILGIPRGAPVADVRRCYREKILHYHPDRVQHLGGEFRELAEEKTRELNAALQRIERELGERRPCGRERDG